MVKHITYKGKKYPVRIGYYALKKVKEEFSKGLADIEEGDIEVYEPLLFYGLKQGAKVEGEDFDFKLEDMEQVLDECFFEFIKIIPLFFQEGGEEAGNQMKKTFTQKVKENQKEKNKQKKEK
jgi:hypothetical protein